MTDMCALKCIKTAVDTVKGKTNSEQEKRIFVVI